MSRALPRVFVPGADLSEPFELPRSEWEKFHKVLRLGNGDPIAVLPNDGTLWECRLEGRRAVPVRCTRPEVEPETRVTIAQALPKGDRIETVCRMGTEIGVVRFVLFLADRSVVRWDAEKRQDRIRRLEAIVREAAEQSFRTRLPEIVWCDSLGRLLDAQPDAIVLSESEAPLPSLARVWRERRSAGSREATLVVGPEGGWSPAELAAIGERGVTLGPRVLRTDTAGPAAAARILLDF
ncbi:MAG: RsmE family RNA methyltransferase [Fimbriimonadaceae bacterium]